MKELRRESPDRAVIEDLSRRLRAPLRRFFEKRIGRRHEEIDDLIQEVFARLTAGGRIESIEALEPYLFQTATNLLKDRHRRALARDAERHEPYEDSRHGGFAETLSPERTLLGLEQLERLIGALLALPERTRTVWVLYHFEDQSHAQIASSLGMARSTVEKHMSRANAHLLKSWNRYR